MQQRSVGPFCSIVVDTMTGSGNSLTSLLDTYLGEGAEAYCKENDGVYRLQYDSIPQLAPTYISSSPNGYTWVLQNPDYWFSGGSGITAFFNTLSSQTPASATWTAMKTGANYYVANGLFPTTSDFWSIDTTTGVMTLSANAGRTRGYLLIIQASLFSSSAADVEINYTVNGTQFIGGNITAGIPGSTVVTPNASGLMSATFVGLQTMPAGSFIQPIFRRAGAQQIIFSTVSMNLTPIGIRY